MDFLTGIPEANSFNAINIFVDKLTKQVFIVPGTKEDSAEKIASQYFENVFICGGFANEFISDCDYQFTSEFWTALSNILKIDL